jgi:hypothetical protein
MTNIDRPTREDIVTLAGIREQGCISLYAPASPNATESEYARIEIKSRLRQAVQQLEAAGTNEELVTTINRSMDRILDDPEFWRRQSNSVAVFVNGSTLTSFRLANNLLGFTEVSDRFAITPLLRAATFAHSAHVLALAQNSVRLIDVSPDSPGSEVTVPGLPKDLQSTVALDITNDRDTLAHLRNSEDPKIRMLEYSQAVDRALRPVLAGSNRPLILAATEPLASIFRSACTYPGLAPSAIGGNPEERSAVELARGAAPVLDELHAAELATQTARFEEGTPQDLVERTLAGVALAATFKAIDTLFVDIDHHVPGLVDEMTGVITRSDAEDAYNYDVIDEIVRRALASDAKVFAIRAADVPGDGPVAAILRFPVHPD